MGKKRKKNGIIVTLFIDLLELDSNRSVLSITIIHIENRICDQSSNLDEAVYVSLCVNALGKDMNPSDAPTRYREIEQVRFFSHS